MPASEPGGVVLTERQKKWFATVQANFEKNTGKPLTAWLEVMKSCPETTPRAQTAWLKAEHGVLQNHAAHILDAMKPTSGMGWGEPQALRRALWKDPAALAILEAVECVATDVEGVIVGQRKGYTAFSRTVQFVAMRPLKGGRALLGLKLDPTLSPRLTPSVRKESWSERLTSIVELDNADQVDVEVSRLFSLAAERGLASG
ncbi:hypothetical protein KOAAANKH_03546 [Brevundimonas sp. NIBR10]|uniref:DUF4287 domain-containing protein n=1 Tax=Brevundimonas sp. NIBR10 TaxID=3015997 RepID=UPI0022F15DB3|nr:DUF4287 domain-containing protein [Brevundimonas sp. NIBR10]WGM48642.1 hypothetical protein KOAAANKH_03546 [Brevundimonas sp. NIBR10]